MQKRNIIAPAVFLLILLCVVGIVFLVRGNGEDAADGGAVSSQTEENTQEENIVQESTVQTVPSAPLEEMTGVPETEELPIAPATQEAAQSSGAAIQDATDAAEADTDAAGGTATEAEPVQPTEPQPTEAASATDSGVIELPFVPFA